MAKARQSKAKTKQAKTKAKPQVLASNQFGRVVEINTYEDKKGNDKEIYTVALDDNEFLLFTLFERKDFKLRLDDIVLPSIAIVPMGYMDKNNQPKSRNTPVVNWVLSTGEVEEDSEDSEEDLDDSEGLQ